MGSIARLVALLALAAGIQLFAPIQATALDDANPFGGCQPGMGLPPGFGINEFGEICQFAMEGGASGPGDNAGGAAPPPAPAPPPEPEHEQEPEWVIIQGEPPPQCLLRPWTCNGRRGDGVDPLNQRKETPRSGGKEIGRGKAGKAKRATPQECQKLGEDGMVRDTPSERKAAITKKSRTIAHIQEEVARLRNEIAEIYDRGAVHSPDQAVAARDTERLREARATIRSLNRDSEFLEKEIDLILESREKYYEKNCPTVLKRP